MTIDLDKYVGGSKYLTKEDLNNEEWELTIAKVTEAEFDDRNNPGRKVTKLIVWFDGLEKGLANGVLNNRALKYAFGPIPDWTGKSVVLYLTDTSLPDGSATKRIAIRPSLPKRVIKKGAAPARPTSENPGDGMEGHLDDEIPF